MRTGLFYVLRKLSLEKISNFHIQAEVKFCEFIAVYENNITTAGRSVRVSPAENNPITISAGGLSICTNKDDMKC